MSDEKHPDIVITVGGEADPQTVRDRMREALREHQGRADKVKRLEKLRTFLALLPAGVLRSHGNDFMASSTKRLMQRLATDLGYWPLDGRPVSELYGVACADLERELYGDTVPPPAKGDTWE